MSKSNLQPHSTGDFLSDFNDPTTITFSAPPTAQSLSFNPSDPQVAAAMAHAREQERNAHHQAVQKEREARLAAEIALKAKQDAEAEAVRQAEEARIAGLKGNEKTQAELLALRRQVEQATQAAQVTTEEANRRILAWQVQAMKKDIVLQYQGQIDPHLLDTSSPEALQASVPRAVQAFKDQEAFFYRKFLGAQQSAQRGLQQNIVEGLAPYPQNPGLPTPNNAGSVVEASAMGPVQANFMHPQIDGGASYAQVREMAHGRVYQTQAPMAGSQYFQTGYQQAMPPMPAQQPQGYPTGPVMNPQMQGMPYGQAPAQGYPQTPTPPAFVPAQGPTQVPLAPSYAPLPDPTTQANRGMGRSLGPAEVEAARYQAAAVAQNARVNPAGLPRDALNGQSPQTAAVGGGPAGPVHQGPAVTHIAQHPMFRNSA